MMRMYPPAPKRLFCVSAAAGAVHRAAAAALGAGTGPDGVGFVLGITKAYTTRVGSGPFPTELENDTGQKLRDAGAEYGSTTGRPRRCGWLDLVAVRYTAAINGVDALVLTKPLGTGVLTTALKNETFSAEDVSEAIAYMKMLNEYVKKR